MPDNTDQVSAVPFSTRDKLMMGLQGLKPAAAQTPNPMEQVIASDYQQRLFRAQKAQKDLAYYTGVLASKMDPDTHQQMTPEAEAKYNEWKQQAQEIYEKTAGVGKEGKDLVKKHVGLLDHLMQFAKLRGHAAQPPNAGTPPSNGGLPAPPVRYDAAAQADATRHEAEADGSREFDSWKKKQDVLKANKIEEDKALQTAKANSGASVGTPPRPVFSRPTSTLDARDMAKSGKTYEDENGNTIDLSKIPDSSSLQPFTTRITEIDDQGNRRQVWKTRYLVISPDQRQVTVGNESYAIPPANMGRLTQGAGVDLGQKSVGSTTQTHDPTTGQTTTSTRTPVTPGANGRAARKGGLPHPPALSSSQNKTSPRPQSSGSPPVDNNGHISPDFKGATPQVIEGANQLIDGKDIKDINGKVRELSASLARKTGWFQGKFNPNMITALKEASTFMDKMYHSDALSVLDDGSLDSANLVIASDDPAKKNIFGKLIQRTATKSLNDKQAKFMREYNQLVGVIGGMRGIIQPGSRGTEAAINRILKELPNVVTSQSSKDAKQRLDLLKQEMAIALQRGTFDTAKMPPPPDKKNKTIDDDIMDKLKALDNK